jgi:hypothetical protein
MEGDEQIINFDPANALVVRVIRAGLVQHNDRGAMRCWANMVIEEDGREFEVNVTCAAWLSYLHGSIQACADQPEQRYQGFHLHTKGQYHNLLGIHGIKQPDDWQDQLEAMGLGRTRPKANDRPPAAVPGSAGADLPGQTTIEDM